MITITKAENCCGCSACYNICPKNAITMEPDKEGFLYPSVKSDKCVDCGLCEKVCPIDNKHPLKNEETKGYIVRNRDKLIVQDSTSGGAFTAFAKYVLSKSGVVFGAGYDENMKVICKMASDEYELAEMRGSKFVQSNLGNTFKQIKQLLNEDVLVLFSGTPCQVAGLLSFLGNKPENLICIDFVCRGVPSPGLWDNYIHMMQKKYNSKIVSAKFKNKTYGYHASTMRVEFANGKVWYGSGRVDPMMKAFVNEMASRPSCSNCAFKSIERPSDITMFDCYEFTKITQKHDDDKGYSSLFIHTDKGNKLFSEINDEFETIEASINELVEANGIMVLNSAKPSIKRNAFYEATSIKPIDEVMQDISPITTRDKFIEFIKRILVKFRLIIFIKKFRHGTVEINNVG